MTKEAWRELDGGWRSAPATGAAARLGMTPGMVVQELGWDNDTDDELRVAIEDAIDADMVDGDYGNVVDAVMLWWRDDDGDLVDALVDALTDLVGGGAIWLLTPKVGRPQCVDAADIAEAAPIAGLSQTTTAAVSKDWPATRLVAPKTARLTRDPYSRQDQTVVTSLRAARLDRGHDPAACSAAPGVIRPYGPRTLVALGRTVVRWGTGPAGGFASLAVRDPDRVGLVDELGELTFGEMHRRSNALARALAELGVGEGDSVAVMCRNHRGFVDASIAVAKLGADLLYLNTAFAGPQLVDVLEREQPTVVVHDEEFTGLLAKAHVEQRLIAWARLGPRRETLEALIEGHDGADLDPPRRHARIVILTSRHDRHPQGRARATRPASTPPSRMLSRMPLRHGWRTHIAAPLFHTWGFAHLALSMLLGSTVVLHRKFDPEDALRTVEENRCESLVVIPVMLQRILALDEEVLGRYSLPTLKVVAASGSALPGTLATSWMDHFGDNLYNIYGSTEVAYASIATPQDLREAPSSAGHAAVRHGRADLSTRTATRCPAGSTGRIFVGNSLLFEGYTGGGSKDMIDGLMATGDVGRFDEDGRLYVEGRDDEMIVSGGENVFPKEVEDCLVGHEAVAEAAAVGVDDDDYGKRLRAFVARKGDVTEDELKDYVKTNLARYKVPREIVFLDELPRNATGKVLKRDLAELGRDRDEGQS